MFILNPDQYLRPAYRISPFRTKDIALNYNLPDSCLCDEYLSDRFAGRTIQYTLNGREALNIALSHFDLQSEDVVTIFTTSGNFYISGCVTAEIEKYCKWSREITPATKLILVNHEFGYPYADLVELKHKYKLPIIEDCAHSFYSEDENNSIGKVGDFVIYSFPKVFPMQIGGLLVSNLPDVLNENTALSADLLRHIKNVCSEYVNKKAEIIRARRSNYSYLRDKFAELGFKERFPLTEKLVPGVFMFSTKGSNIDLPQLKKYYYDHGVQCSVFYGENAFFLPVHQNLTKEDAEYFIEVIKVFLICLNN